MRETRDLLRRRTFFVRTAGRADRPRRQITNSQYNLPPFAKKLIYAANRAELKSPSASPTRGAQEPSRSTWP